MQQQRRLALTARRSMSASERTAASEIICDKLIRSPQFRGANMLACYLPMSDEVDSRSIIERAWCANKRVFLPVVKKHGTMLFREIRPDTLLHRSQMGLWEPRSGDVVSARQLQLAVVPTVAFDDHCHRIGMGGGYYDRYFSFLKHRRIWHSPKLLGIAFDCQQVSRISPNPWDVPLFQVFTESV